MTAQRLHLWDFVAIGFYFLAVIGAGIYAMVRSRRNTVNGYFLAGRFMTWLPVGASLFASNIGSEHFIGLAGSGAASGIAVGAFELNACILLQLLGWVFLPVYIASGVCTLPEYIKKRFGGERIRIYLSILSLMLYIFTKISVNLYSGALFIQQALNWNLYLAVVILLGLTALTTVTGGLAAVIYTDTLQAFVMIIGACLLTILGFREVGGYSELYRRYMLAIPDVLGPWSTPSLPDPLASNSSNFNTTTVTAAAAVASSVVSSVIQNLSASNVTDTAMAVLSSSSISEFVAPANRSALLECGRPRADSWYMLRDSSDPDMPWPGFLLGQTPASIWYWCADQMIVQRTLAAKSLSHAQGSTLFAGYLKILPVFILVMPGMISRVLFTDEVACVDPDVCMKVCQNRRGCSNIAFPKLVLEIMPTGLKGLMMSVMLAALVSDLTSIFNSASTLFTMDIYRNFKKGTTTRELMIVGRLFVGLMVLVGILWIPVVQNMQGAQLFIYIQSVSAYLAPPIAAVYLMAILWKRANEKGAFTSLMVGLFLGSGQMILNFTYQEPLCGQPDTRPWLVSGLHYMYFAFFLFLLTCVILVVVSLLTEEPDESQISRTTYWTRFDPFLRSASVLDSSGETKTGGTVGNTPSDEKKFLDSSTSDGRRKAAGEVAEFAGDSVARETSVEIILDDPKKVKVLSPLEMENEYDIDNPVLSVDSDGSQTRRSFVSRFVEWFCGLGSSDDEAVRDGRTRVEEIQKLKQTPTEKILLGTFLALLLSIDIFFYIFFSTGSDFWLLRTPVVDASTSHQ